MHPVTSNVSCTGQKVILIYLFFLPVAFLFIFLSKARAGLDEYTYLDKIKNWTIERKIDSSTEKIFCRASIFSGGTWFGSRSRLNQEDKLVLLENKNKQKGLDKLTLDRVKLALKACRSHLFYNPNY